MFPDPLLLKSLEDGCHRDNLPGHQATPKDASLKMEASLGGGEGVMAEPSGARVSGEIA